MSNVCVTETHGCFTISNHVLYVLCVYVIVMLPFEPLHRALSTELLLGQQLHKLSDILCWLLYIALACCELYTLLGGGEVVLSHHIRCSRLFHYTTTRILALLILPETSSILFLSVLETTVQPSPFQQHTKSLPTHLVFTVF